MPSETPESIAPEREPDLISRLAREAAEMAYLEAESARYAASRATPKADAAYADEDPGDGDRRRHGR